LLAIYCESLKQSCSYRTIILWAAIPLPIAQHWRTRAHGPLFSYLLFCIEVLPIIFMLSYNILILWFLFLCKVRPCIMVCDEWCDTQFFVYSMYLYDLLKSVAMASDHAKYSTETSLLDVPSSPDEYTIPSCCLRCRWQNL